MGVFVCVDAKRSQSAVKSSVRRQHFVGNASVLCTVGDQVDQKQMLARSAVRQQRPFMGGKRERNASKEVKNFENFDN